ncbi:MAG: hypothetical protein COB66_08325 [Coxiella sp. (in: Bacteria)]|nr:MAG: hypothetical protein COB66_08325 [Coxiella sp. (in: g-proteobacteria)]
MGEDDLLNAAAGAGSDAGASDVLDKVTEETSGADASDALDTGSDALDSLQDVMGSDSDSKASTAPTPQFSGGGSKDEEEEEEEQGKSTGDSMQALGDHAQDGAEAAMKTGDAAARLEAGDVSAIGDLVDGVKDLVTAAEGAAKELGSMVDKSGDMTSGMGSSSMGKSMGLSMGR